MSIGNLDGHYNSLLVAPHEMKPALLKLIDQEIQKAKQFRYGFIGIKANSLSERDLLDKLAEASQAGVKIQLLIRGICCLLHGVAQATENIEIRSIVGRFLEHPRIYIFGTGENREVLLGSADGMTRNLNYRVEILCPVKDAIYNTDIHYWMYVQDNESSSSTRRSCSLSNTWLNCNAQSLMEEAQQRDLSVFAQGKGFSERCE
jgi:polyphosphate kinase